MTQVEEHKNWWCCTDRDVYYCEGCDGVITKNELFMFWREDELFQTCLNRIAFIKGFKSCEGRG